MEEKITIRRQCRYKKYRKSQRNKGVTRFELQVSNAAKARFDALVTEAANEYTTPWDPRQRLAKARAQVFDEITQGVTHEFFTLKDQIEALKAEIKALSPQFFKTSKADKTPLPEAINALPNDPKQLKALLAKTYQEAQHAKRETIKYQRAAKQYEALYQAAYNYNEELKAKLEAY